MPAVVILMTSPARSLATNHGLYAKPVCAPIGLPCCCTMKPRPSPGVPFPLFSLLSAGNLQPPGIAEGAMPGRRVGIIERFPFAS